ncbi:MAG: hypothetical protein JWM57_3767 [Phycisphaerales bacterium]|nr:hypothetical protein [Phycisphaerales bacterium]
MKDISRNALWNLSYFYLDLKKQGRNAVHLHFEEFAKLVLLRLPSIKPVIPCAST